METLNIVSWAIAGLGLLASVLSWIKTLFVKTGSKKETKFLDNVYNWAIEAEKTFENIPQSGKLKLNQVLSNALRYAVNNNIKYDEEKIKLEVEKIIETTKFINARNCDKVDDGETECSNMFQSCIENNDDDIKDIEPYKKIETEGV